MKTHIVYAARPGEAAEARPDRPDAVPHLKGAGAAPLARHVAAKGGLTVQADGLDYFLEVPQGAAPLIARIGGGRSLGEIAAALGLDWLAFGAAWGPVHRALGGFNLLHYSRGARR